MDECKFQISPSSVMEALRKISRCQPGHALVAAASATHCRVIVYAHAHTYAQLLIFTSFPLWIAML